MGIASATTEIRDVPLAQESASNVSVSGGRWDVLTLSSILLLALLLRMWGLDQNGWGAEYYTAAVRSMATNWHNFFYTAFDPDGFISVDKPPIALWIQVASVKLLGFHTMSVLLPQVVEGVASVWILFNIVRRRFSASAALLAALLLALMPVCVAVSRTNNTDSCLLLVLLLAAWALMKAAEEGNRRALMLSMALIGIAFNIKMLAAFIALPTMFLVYFANAPRSWQRRLADLTLAGIVLMATALPWVLAYELTPPDHRPYVGGSSRNSMLELVVGHNGIGRFVSRVMPTTATPNEPPSAQSPAAQVQTASDAADDAEIKPRGVGPRLFVRAPPGPLRFIDGQLLAQAGWLLPFAAMALALGALPGWYRRPLSPKQLALYFWFCWIVNYVVVYSYAGGIMHFYYLSTIAPALAALAAIGAVSLWARYQQKGSRAIYLPVTLLLTAAWQLYIEVDALGWTFNTLRQASGDWLRWLHVTLIGGTLVAVAGLLYDLSRQESRPSTRVFAASALGLGILALLAVPIAWALSSVLVAGHGVLPSADLYRLDPAVRAADVRIRGRLGQSIDTSRLVRFLQTNRNGERYLLATSTAQVAAPIIIQTGEEVMARGGYHGLNPVLTPEQFAAKAKARQIRFAMLGDVNPIYQRMGADAAGQPIADWIRANGMLVQPRLWRSRGSGIPRGAELYDLLPDAGLVRVPA